ncbi:hypothetical protein GCM10025862_11590 [Arsenicicoccus piscis]|uniref:Uncharacterized protein n=1 Tax=Arsenicicoccus piscis TaxID=673954 RepID=A0ABQ6HL04_9MICO|nr:hypothetical protein GCM10025862_11590 [Arsenicicoccus piscis]
MAPPARPGRPAGRKDGGNLLVRSDEQTATVPEPREATLALTTTPPSAPKMVATW